MVRGKNFQKAKVSLSIVILLTAFGMVSATSTKALGSTLGSMSGSSEPSDSDSEYSFNWLDPDKKIYVLQNRKYSKSGRALISVLPGVGFSNPYRQTYNIDGRFAFYFAESLGIELFYTYTRNLENSTYKALTAASSVAFPTIREIRAQYGAMLHYVPWYAKINVFNSILYFDWYFGAGAAVVDSYVDTRTSVSQSSSYTAQQLVGAVFSTGHQYHLSQSFIVRMDFTGVLYQAPINGTSGETSWYSNYNFGFGIGLKL